MIKNLISKTIFAGVFAAAALSSAFGQDRPEPIGSTAIRTNPYRLAGRLLFRVGGVVYIGTASVVSGHATLTAAHNLYDPFDGFSTRIEFERGLYGSRALQRATPKSSVIFAGYINSADFYGSENSRTFAKDLGVLRFNATLAGGERLEVRNQLSLLTQSGTFKESLGYGAQRHSGNQLLSASTTARSRQIRPGYFDNNGFVIEGGMSGGPVLVTSGSRILLLAINVSGSRIDTGLRGIDSAAYRFIRSNQ